MAKKLQRGLGKGLGALLGEDVLAEAAQAEAAQGKGADAVRMLPIGQIDPNRDQPRRRFDEAALNELAASIRAVGVLQPIIVSQEGERYTIIAGERRYRASRLAGLNEIPAIVRDWDSQRRLEAALIENLQRDDLNPVEEAAGVRRLMDEAGLTQEKVAERLGKSRPAVANMLRLLSLPDEVAEMVRDGLLSQGHARVLAGLKDPEEQLRLARKAVDEGLNVRQMEQLVKASGSKPKKKPAPKRIPAELEELQEKIRVRTGMKSTLTGSIAKGRIVLQYSSREELEHLNDMLDRLGE